nr:zinc finger, CCHC-type [Tanacetum cinerariifolium]
SSRFFMKDMREADVILVSTPMDTSEKLMANNVQAVSQLDYSRVIGCLMYAMTCKRPNIDFVVGKLSREDYWKLSLIVGVRFILDNGDGGTECTPIGLSQPLVGERAVSKCIIEQYSMSQKCGSDKGKKVTTRGAKMRPSTDKPTIAFRHGSEEKESEVQLSVLYISSVCMDLS